MSAWSDDLSEWLKPFLARLGHKARRRMCPLYVAGLIGPGERKSVGPMAERWRRATTISCTISSRAASGTRLRLSRNSRARRTAWSAERKPCW